MEADHSGRGNDQGLTVYGGDVVALVEDAANGEPYGVRPLRCPLATHRGQPWTR